MTDDPREHSACLGLGSNLEADDRLPQALAALDRAPGVEVVAVSSAWESPAVGTAGPDYLNAALLVRTRLSRDALKAELRRIEADLGRVRGAEPSPLVTIDIDLLTFDADVLAPDLWGLAYRALPVSELLPDLASPSTGESLADAAHRLASTPIAARPEILQATVHGVAPSLTAENHMADGTTMSAESLVESVRGGIDGQGRGCGRDRGGLDLPLLRITHRESR